MQAKPTEAVLTFEQPKDCCDGCELSHQSLTVGVTDGGGGPFLYIQTDRWAIDNPKELARLLSKCLRMCRGTFDDTEDAKDGA